MDFFTWEQLVTVAGATAATVIIVDAARAAFGISPRWLALAVAALISLAAWIVTAEYTVDTGLLAVLNTFVVYMAATGSQSVISRTRKFEPARGDTLPLYNGDWRAPW